MLKEVQVKGMTDKEIDQAVSEVCLNEHVLAGALGACFTTLVVMVHQIWLLNVVSILAG